MLVNYPTETNDVRFRDTNGAKQAMRESAKNILYVVANSRQYDPANLNTSIPKWKIIMFTADAVIALLCLALLSKFFSNYRRRKAGEMK
jgi:beta-glucosidase